MTVNTVRMTSQQLEDLHSNLMSETENESAVFLIAGFFENDHGCHFTVRDVLVPGEGDYTVRNGHHLEMSPMFFNRAISAAEKNHITVIQCHSHPFAKNDLQYSASDFAGESTSARTVHDCLGKRPMGSLLFGQDSIIGRAWLSPEKTPVQIDQLRIVDRHMDIRHLAGERDGTDVNTDLFDRQIRAFGMSGQKILSGLRVGIVGVGGTGSAVAEQLARSGLDDFVLVDHDKFSVSNRTRMYGSYAHTTDLHKVEIVRENICRISPGAAVATVPEDVISQRTLDRLKNCDVVFGCVDAHAPRSVLNEMAHQFFIPVIDVGVGIDARDGRIAGGTVRMTLSSPSLPCLYCTGVIRPETIQAESLSVEDRKSRLREGYIQGADNDDDAPSVVSLTSMAASYAVLFLKDLLFFITESDSNMLHMDIRRLKTSMISSQVKGGCVCVARMGKGGYMPLSAPPSAAEPPSTATHSAANTPKDGKKVSFLRRAINRLTGSPE